MSRTEMCAAGADGDFHDVAEFRNSWRGAMFVWSTLAARYATGETLMDMYKKTWALQNDPRLTDAEHYVLHTTFDNALVDREMAPTIIEALRDFGLNERGDGGSLAEQADALEKAFADPATRAVGWNQTTVNASPWFIYDEEKDEGRPYNLDRDTKHHFIQRRAKAKAA